MARAANDPAHGPTTPEEPHHPEAKDGHGTCPVAWCPICLAVTTVQPLKPEMIEHLLKAGTEMLLALRAVIDARADEMTDDGERATRPTGLEKIDLG
jgi:hypothetical protein